jgi:acetoin utilization protein AcuB
MNLDFPIATLMTTNVKCVEPNQKIIDLKHIYEQQKFHHHIPVIENNKLIGMVSLIDFMRAIHTASLDDNELVYHTIEVKDIMSSNPVTIHENTSIKQATELLAKGEFHSLVVAENNEVKGIVTTADLLNYFLKNS